MFVGVMILKVIWSKIFSPVIYREGVRPGENANKKTTVNWIFTVVSS
jgi:hypothetical protein